MGLYCVYEHVFPNGKRYIGITKNLENRWNGNGNQYFCQQKIARAIKKYGWENIEHNVIIDGLTEEQAKSMEMYLIRELDTIENGYNTTIGGDNILSTYLNAHVLQMINESKKIDETREYEQNEDDIVSYAEKAKYNSSLADIFNYADTLVQEKYNEYKFYKGSGCPLHNFHEIRVDCYWWTIQKLIENGFEIDFGIDNRPYFHAWQKEFFNADD